MPRELAAFEPQPQIQATKNPELLARSRAADSLFSLGDLQQTICTILKARTLTYSKSVCHSVTLKKRSSRGVGGGDGLLER
jgi:hypothetical protein